METAFETSLCGRHCNIPLRFPLTNEGLTPQILEVLLVDSSQVSIPIYIVSAEESHLAQAYTSSKGRPHGLTDGWVVVYEGLTPHPNVRNSERSSHSPNTPQDWLESTQRLHHNLQLLLNPASLPLFL